MTVAEAVQTLDARKPNSYELHDKLAWLSALDGLLHREVLQQHLPAPAPFAGYDASTAPECVLLADEPYATELYLRWLESRVDYYNGDTARFNNALSQFEAAYREYARWYHRSHTPLSQRRKYW